MKHRRPTQHIRRYRSGRWIFVNRGIKYYRKCYGSSIKQEKSIFRLLDEIAQVDKRRMELFNQRKKARGIRKDKQTLTPTEEKWLEDIFTEDLELAKKRAYKETAIKEEYSFMSPKEKTEFLSSIEPDPDNWPKLIKNLTNQKYDEDEGLI